MSGIVSQIGARSGILDSGGLPSSGTVTQSGTTQLDYEEGTWTPALSSGTVTATNSVYTKIGNLVYVVLYMKAFSDNTGGGNLTVTTLPFTSASTGSSHGTCLTSYFAIGEEAVSVVNNSSTNMVFHHSDSGADYYAIPHSAIANDSTSTRLFATLTYRTAS